MANEKASGHATVDQPRVIYEYPRLAFFKVMIEWLREQDSFRVITKQGTFQMTKAELYRDFKSVVNSASYQDQNLYHSKPGSKLMKEAQKYRIA